MTKPGNRIVRAVLSLRVRENRPAPLTDAEARYIDATNCARHAGVPLTADEHTALARALQASDGTPPPPPPAPRALSPGRENPLTCPRDAAPPLAAKPDAAPKEN